MYTEIVNIDYAIAVERVEHLAVELAGDTLIITKSWHLTFGGYYQPHYRIDQLTPTFRKISASYREGYTFVSINNMVYDFKARKRARNNYLIEAVKTVLNYI